MVSETVTHNEQFCLKIVIFRVKSVNIIADLDLITEAPASPISFYEECSPHAAL